MRRLHFIRHARDLGFSVDDIRQLLALSEHPTKSCDALTLSHSEGASPSS
jgi:DNA-binding transcriptional MerR regulator